MLENEVPAEPAATAAPNPDPAPAAADTAAAPAADPKKKDDPIQARMNQIPQEKWDERRRADAAEQRAKALEEELAALKKPAAPTPAPAATPAPTPTPAPAANPAAPDAAAVRQAAEQLLRQQQFAARCNATYEAGKKDHTDFDEALKGFNQFGGLAQHPALVDAATTVEDGHRVLHHLGSNPAEAERVLQLSPTQQAIEVARLAEKLKPAKPGVSAAPAPVNPIKGAGGNPDPKPDDNGEFRNQADYRAWRKKQFQK